MQLVELSFSCFFIRRGHHFVECMLRMIELRKDVGHNECTIRWKINIFCILVYDFLWLDFPEDEKAYQDESQPNIIKDYDSSIKNWMRVYLIETLCAISILCRSETCNRNVGQRSFHNVNFSVWDSIIVINVETVTFEVRYEWRSCIQKQDDEKKGEIFKEGKVKVDTWAELMAGLFEVKWRKFGMVFHGLFLFVVHSLSQIGRLFFLY